MSLETDQHEPPTGTGRGCRNVDAAVRELDGVDASSVRRAATDRSPQTTQVPEDHERVLFELEGLDCVNCEALIERAIETVDGISNVTACRRENAVRIDRDPDIEHERLRSRLEELGYPVSSRDRVVENRRRREFAEARFVAGIMAGLMMLAPYAGVIYPTRVSYPFFDATVVAHLEAALASAWAPYFYLNLALLSGLVLTWTGKPILEEATAALRSRSPNSSLLIAAIACWLYLYSTVIAFGGFEGGVYYDLVVGLIVGVTIAREAEFGVGSGVRDHAAEPVVEGEPEDSSKAELASERS